MTQTTTLAALQSPRQPADIRVGFDSLAGFEALQRMARLFASSSLVPKEFQGNAIGNAAIALDMANRMGANPLMVMQNLYIVSGNRSGNRPAWSAKFLIATLNQSGRFSALRYRFQGSEGSDDWGCRAYATELSTGEVLEGPLITIGLAKAEGWHDKSGSKWKTIPELMLRYRAASWFVSAYAPEIAMGLRTAEEEQDAVDYIQQPDGSFSPAPEARPATITTADIARVAQPDPAPVEPAPSALEEAATPEEAAQPAPEPAPETQPKPTAAPEPVAAPEPAPESVLKPQPAPKKAAKKNVEAAPKDDGLTVLRAQTQTLMARAGMPLERAVMYASSKAPDEWTRADCELLQDVASSMLDKKHGGAPAKAEQLKPVAAPESAGRAREGGLRLCHMKGEHVARLHCVEMCHERGACPKPAWK